MKKIRKVDLYEEDEVATSLLCSPKSATICELSVARSEMYVGVSAESEEETCSEYEESTCSSTRQKSSSPSSAPDTLAPGTSSMSRQRAECMRRIKLAEKEKKRWEEECKRLEAEERRQREEAELRENEQAEKAKKNAEKSQKAMEKEKADSKKRKGREIDEGRARLEEVIRKAVARYPERLQSDKDRYRSFADGFNYAKETRWEVDEVSPCSRCTWNEDICWRRVLSSPHQSSCLRCIDKKKSCVGEEPHHEPESESEMEAGPSKRTRVGGSGSDAQSMLEMMREVMACTRETATAFGEVVKEMRSGVTEMRSAMGHVVRELKEILEDHAMAQSVRPKTKTKIEKRG